MKMQKLVLGTVFALAAASANADSLFSDDFNRHTGSTVGNGWTESPTSDVSIVSGGHPNNAMRLIGNPHSGSFLDVVATQLSIDATGFDTIVFSFDWKGLGENEQEDNQHAPLDKLFAGYNIDGGGWVNLTPTIILQEDHWIHATYSLSPVGDNQSNIGIRFATVVNNSEDGVRIDNVSVTGESSPPIFAASPVPEPQSYAMFLAGLGLLGFTASRRNRKVTPAA